MPGDRAPTDGEISVSGRGGVWWVRVLGRAGRVGGAAAPLLLLGFRAEGAEAPALQSLAPGRALSDLTQEVLESALSRATEAVPPGGRRPFFEDADGARRT